MPKPSVHATRRAHLSLVHAREAAPAAAPARASLLPPNWFEEAVGYVGEPGHASVPLHEACATNDRGPAR